MTADLIVTNATLVTADAAGTVLHGAALAVEGGRIVRIGSAGEIGTAARDVHDIGGAILMPGLINTHCHAADSLFRGLVEDLALEPWLQTVWKAEGAILTPQTVRLGAALGLAELLLGGVTSVMDMFWYPRQTALAGIELGMRVATGGIFIDGPGVDGGSPEQRIADATAFFDEFGGHELILPGTFPHGTYTVAPESMRTSRDLADRHDALWSTHAAETRAEVADISARYGRSVIRHLDQLGLLDTRTVLAHCVWIDDEEIAILARSGASVAHNPVSNLKLASGIARIPAMLAAGVRVTLGTDGAISGNDLDMWLALRLAATLHKGFTLQADAVTTGQALKMVTQAGADALGVGDRLGSLEPGKLADMIVIDIDRPHAVPMFDPLTHIIYSCTKSDVRDVYVGGRQVVRNRELTGIDLGGVLKEVSALAPSIARSIAG